MHANKLPHLDICPHWAKQGVPRDDISLSHDDKFLYASAASKRRKHSVAVLLIELSHYFKHKTKNRATCTSCARYASSSASSPPAPPPPHLPRARSVSGSRMQMSPTRVGVAGDVAAAAATNESAALDLRPQEEPPGRSEEAAAIESAESEIDRREAIATPSLKAPPPSPEVDAAMAAGDSERQPKQQQGHHHHHHLRSGSAKNMARHSVLERSLCAAGSKGRSSGGTRGGGGGGEAEGQVLDVKAPPGGGWCTGSSTAPRSRPRTPPPPAPTTNLPERASSP
ncbi:hypothetical protein SELMODRAFT_408730 [Selaginella moellendorffii]|uniref:Uncharacterized protein n=1 Tax=Selaginella moellendorffii TaxID=88036 RepID=D8R9S5_SELML|nr:hypothetical protein SELMODRAFT_408730 [Selaginella moellendorffii]